MEGGLCLDSTIWLFGEVRRAGDEADGRARRVQLNPQARRSLSTISLPPVVLPVLRPVVLLAFWRSFHDPSIESSIRSFISALHSNPVFQPSPSIRLLKHNPSPKAQRQNSVNPGIPLCLLLPLALLCSSRPTVSEHLAGSHQPASHQRHRVRRLPCIALQRSVQ